MRPDRCIVAGDGDRRHGTVRGYLQHGCRCDACKAAAIPADDPRHGTYNGYSNGRCRCDACKAAKAQYFQDEMARHPERREARRRYMETYNRTHGGAK